MVFLVCLKCAPFFKLLKLRSYYRGVHFNSKLYPISLKKMFIYLFLLSSWVLSMYIKMYNINTF